METEDKPIVPPVVPPATPPADPPANSTEPDPAIAAAKKEADELREERDRLKAEKEERETADLSEKEKAEKRAKEAEEKAQATEARLHRQAVIQAARDTASELKVELDREALTDLYEAGAFRTIKLDEKTGTPVGVVDLMKTLVKTKPYIVKAAKAAAPDINADKAGSEKKGEDDAARQARLKKRFRLKG